MSSDISTPTLGARGAAPQPEPGKRPRRRVSTHATLTAHGEPLVWLTGGALAIAVVMVVGLLALVVYQGAGTFWPKPLVELKLADVRLLLGEVTRREPMPTDAHPGKVAPSAAGSDNSGERQLMRVGNFELTGAAFQWVDDARIAAESRPQWALAIERLENGPFYGELAGLLVDGKVVATTPQEAYAKFNELHPAVRARWRQSVALNKSDLGVVNRTEKDARLAAYQAELDYGADSPRHARAAAAFATTAAWATGRRKEIAAAVTQLERENARYHLRVKPVQGAAVDIPLETIVRAYPANQLSVGGKLGVYASRWWEFLTDDPRDSNTAGGYFPAIWGTVAMTLIMTLMVVPFGVLAALYLREYAKPGTLTSAVRIAINNLAGVPSIVFGAFGLGFFCYGVGKYIDGGPESPWPAPIWFAVLAGVVGAGVTAFFFGLASTARLNQPRSVRQNRIRIAATVLWLASLAAAVALVAKTPFFHGFFRAELLGRDQSSTYGTGGLLWASMTLALLTAPVVIIATEEALAAVPNSMREGSYACGASHWQTIRRIVLPRAMPGIMTGLILAMARGAGEVAPLMLVGVKKESPDLPLDTVFPYIHPERSFLHLAYMIYDVGFQSPDSEAAKPMVYTTTLLLIAIVALLNVAAVRMRQRLRRKFVTTQF